MKEIREVCSWIFGSRENAQQHMDAIEQRVDASEQGVEAIEQGVEAPEQRGEAADQQVNAAVQQETATPVSPFIYPVVEIFKDIRGIVGGVDHITVNKWFNTMRMKCGLRHGVDYYIIEPGHFTRVTEGARTRMEHMDAAAVAAGHKKRVKMAERDALVRAEMANIDPKYLRVTAREKKPAARTNLPMIQQPAIPAQPTAPRPDADGNFSARDVWAYLGVKDSFRNWIQRRIKKYDLIENEHYFITPKSGRNSGRGRPTKGYHIPSHVCFLLTMGEGKDYHHHAKMFINSTQGLAESVKQQTLPRGQANILQALREDLSRLISDDVTARLDSIEQRIAALSSAPSIPQLRETTAPDMNTHVKTIAKQEKEINTIKAQLATVIGAHEDSILSQDQQVILEKEMGARCAWLRKNEYWPKGDHKVSGLLRRELKARFIKSVSKEITWKSIKQQHYQAAREFIAAYIPVR